MVATTQAPEQAARAYLKGAHISASKMRLVANQVRGKPVADALDMLSFNPRKGAFILRKLLQSAVANAENNRGLDSDRLHISELCVDEGITMKRIKPRARGKADRIFRRSCHVTLCLGSSE